MISSIASIGCVKHVDSDLFIVNDVPKTLHTVGHKALVYDLHNPSGSVCVTSYKDVGNIHTDFLEGQSTGLSFSSDPVDLDA
jgi:hypothetical protein